MNGLVQSRKFVSRILARLNQPLSASPTPSLLAFGYFLLGRFAVVGVWSAMFLLEIPLHLFRSSTETFSVAALRGPKLDYQESYSGFLRRQRLAVASVLTSLILLVAQLTYLGYTVVQFTIPTQVVAQTGSIDINPTWDTSAWRDQLWSEYNPCVVTDTTYSSLGSSETTLTYGRQVNNPVDCDFVTNYHTLDYFAGLKFSLAGIPNNATITGVNLLLNVSSSSAQELFIGLPATDNLDTLSADDGSLYSAISSSTVYTSVFWSSTGAKDLGLGAPTISHIQSRITGSDILPIGLWTTTSTQDTGAVSSVDHATPGNRPILRVTYTIPPAAPTGLTHSANTPTTLTWSWTDNASGETRYDVRDGSGNVTGCTNLAANSTSCTETGLSANTQYTRTVRVTDAQGTSDSATAAVFTSIQTPTGVSSSTLTASSIAVTATGSLSNLGTGSAALWFEETVTNTNSGWITSTSWNKTGLSPNTTYTFRVKARNGDGDETAFTATSDFSTLATAPDITPARTTSTWYTSGNFDFTNDVPFGTGGVQYYQYQWNTSATSSFNGTQPTWCLSGCDISNATLSQTATDGASWYLHLDGYDSSDLNSGGSLSIGPFYFDSTIPSATGTVNDGSGADISSQTSTTSLSANWAASTDATSGVQKYQYAIGSTAGGTDVIAYTDNGTATSVTASGLTLTIGSTYYVSVRAVDVAGNTGSVTTSNGVTISSSVTPTPSDTTGPVISSIITDATSTTATIRWVTNESATAKVEYGLTTSYGSNVTRTSLATEHQLAITGLTINTTYHFKITSVDGNGNSTSTVDDTLTTVAAPVVSQGVTGPTLLRPVVRDGKYPSITITGVGKGNQTITFYVNDRAVKSIHLEGELTDTKSFAVKLLANLRPTGKYTVTATATQSDGRVSEVRQRLTFRIKAETSGEKYVQPNVVSTYIVHAGDSLWHIAKRMLGDGNRWNEIVDANANRLPSLTTSPTIYVGWALTIPAP